MRRLILRAASILLIGTFAAQDLAFAAGESQPAAASMPVPFFPASLARVESRFAGSRELPAVYLVRDAHANESAQRNIAAILEKLSETHKTELIFLEGGWGDLSLSDLAKDVRADRRQKIAEAFLKKGWIQGADFANLVSERPVPLIGAEERTLYEKGVELYRRASQSRERSLAWADLAARLHTFLKSRLYSPDLQELDEKRSAYRRESGSLFEYLEALVSASQGKGIAVERFEAVRQAVSIRRREREVDFSAAAREQAEAVAALSESDRGALLELARQKKREPFFYGAEGHEADGGFFALLGEKIASRRSDYPNLSAYLVYLGQARKIRFEELLSQTEALETAVFSRLARTEDERQLIFSEHALEILRALFSLKLETAQWELLKRRPDAFDPQELAAYLNSKIMDLGTRHEFALFWENEVGEAYETARAFYENASVRDEAFVETLLSQSQKQNAKRAALVAGGFHTGHLEELLRKRGVPFVSIRPQVYSETNVKKYESLLLKGSTIAPHPGALLRIAGVPVRSRLEEAFAGARLAKKPAKERTLRRQEKRRMEKQKPESGVPGITPRQFLKTLAGAGLLLALEGDGRRRRETEARRNDLWKDDRSGRSRSDVVQGIRNVAEWLRANDFPRMGFVDNYAAILDRPGGLALVSRSPASLAKILNRRTLEATIQADPDLFGRISSEIARLGSQSFFVENRVSFIVGEAAGIEFFKAWNTSERRLLDLDRLDRLQAAYDAAVREGDVPRALERDGAAIRALIADLLVGEYFEIRRRAELYRWATRRGFFKRDKALAEVRSSFLFNPGRADGLIPDLSRSDIDMRTLFTELLLSMAYIMAQEADKLQSDTAYAWKFYFALKPELRANGLRAGGNSSLSLAGPALLEEAALLYPMVERQTRVLEEKIPELFSSPIYIESNAGARLGAEASGDVVWRRQLSDAVSPVQESLPEARGSARVQAGLDAVRSHPTGLEPYLILVDALLDEQRHEEAAKFSLHLAKWIIQSIEPRASTKQAAKEREKTRKAFEALDRSLALLGGVPADFPAAVAAARREAAPFIEVLDRRTAEGKLLTTQIISILEWVVQAELELGRDAEAVRYGLFLEALKFNEIAWSIDTRFSYRLHLAQVLHRLGRFEDARRYAEEARALAQALRPGFETGKATKATTQQSLNAVLAIVSPPVAWLNNRESLALYWTAEALLGAADVSGAADSLDRVMQMNALTPFEMRETRMNAAVVRYFAGDFARASGLLEEARQTAVDDDLERLLERAENLLRWLLEADSRQENGAAADGWDVLRDYLSIFSTPAESLESFAWENHARSLQQSFIDLFLVVRLVLRSVQMNWKRRPERMHVWMGVLQPLLSDDAFEYVERSLAALESGSDQDPVETVWPRLSLRETNLLSSFRDWAALEMQKIRSRRQREEALARIAQTRGSSEISLEMLTHPDELVAQSASSRRDELVESEREAKEEEWLGVKKGVEKIVVVDLGDDIFGRELVRALSDIPPRELNRLARNGGGKPRYPNRYKLIRGLLEADPPVPSVEKMFKNPSLFPAARRSITGGEDRLLEFLGFEKVLDGTWNVRYGRSFKQPEVKLGEFLLAAHEPLRRAETGLSKTGRQHADKAAGRLYKMFGDSLRSSPEDWVVVTASTRASREAAALFLVRAQKGASPESPALKVVELSSAAGAESGRNPVSILSDGRGFITEMNDKFPGKNVIVFADAPRARSVNVFFDREGIEDFSSGLKLNHIPFDFIPVDTDFFIQVHSGSGARLAYRLDTDYGPIHRWNQVASLGESLRRQHKFLSVAFTSLRAFERGSFGDWQRLDSNLGLTRSESFSSLFHAYEKTLGRFPSFHAVLLRSEDDRPLLVVIGLHAGEKLDEIRLDRWEPKPKLALMKADFLTVRPYPDADSLAQTLRSLTFDWGKKTYDLELTPDSIARPDDFPGGQLIYEVSQGGRYAGWVHVFVRDEGSVRLKVDRANVNIPADPAFDAALESWLESKTGKSFTHLHIHAEQPPSERKRPPAGPRETWTLRQIRTTRVRAPRMNDRALLIPDNLVFAWRQGAKKHKVEMYLWTPLEDVSFFEPETLKYGVIFDGRHLEGGVQLDLQHGSMTAVLMSSKVSIDGQADLQKALSDWLDDLRHTIWDADDNDGLRPGARLAVSEETARELKQVQEDIKFLVGRGVSIETIVREMGLGRKTIENLIRKDSWISGPRAEIRLKLFSPNSWIDREATRLRGVIPDGRAILEFVFGKDLEQKALNLMSKKALERGEVFRHLSAEAVAELDFIYKKILQSSVRPLSVSEILEKLKSKFIEEQMGDVQILNDEKIIEKALLWLGTNGFPLRRYPDMKADSGYRWAVTGLARGRFIDSVVRFWPKFLQSRWKRLEGDESAEAVLTRIELLIRANYLSARDVGGESTAHQLSKWRRKTEHWMKTPVDERNELDELSFEEAVELWSDRLGVEPIFLRTGFSRHFWESKLSRNEEKFSSFGSRIRRIRQIEGMTRSVMASFMGKNESRQLFLIETGEADIEDFLKWIPGISAVLRKDPVYLLTNETKSDFLRTAALSDAVRVLRQAKGWPRTKAVDNLLRHVKKQKGTGSFAPSTLRAHLLRLERGQHPPDPDFLAALGEILEADFIPLAAARRGARLARKKEAEPEKKPLMSPPEEIAYILILAMITVAMAAGAERSGAFDSFWTGMPVVAVTGMLFHMYDAWLYPAMQPYVLKFLSLFKRKPRPQILHVPAAAETPAPSAPKGPDLALKAGSDLVQEAQQSVEWKVAPETTLSILTEAEAQLLEVRDESAEQALDLLETIQLEKERLRVQLAFEAVLRGEDREQILSDLAALVSGNDPGFVKIVAARLRKKAVEVDETLEAMTADKLEGLISQIALEKTNVFGRPAYELSGAERRRVLLELLNKGVAEHFAPLKTSIESATDLRKKFRSPEFKWAETRTYSAIRDRITSEAGFAKKGGEGVHDFTRKRNEARLNLAIAFLIKTDQRLFELFKPEYSSSPLVSPWPQEQIWKIASDATDQAVRDKYGLTGQVRFLTRSGEWVTGQPVLVSRREIRLREGPTLQTGDILNALPELVSSQSSSASAKSAGARLAEGDDAAVAGRPDSYEVYKLKARRLMAAALETAKENILRDFDGTRQAGLLKAVEGFKESSLAAIDKYIDLVEMTPASSARRKFGRSAKPARTVPTLMAAGTLITHASDVLRAVPHVEKKIEEIKSARTLEVALDMLDDVEIPAMGARENAAMQVMQPFFRVSGWDNVKTLLKLADARAAIEGKLNQLIRLEVHRSLQSLLDGSDRSQTEVRVLFRNPKKEEIQGFLRRNSGVSVFIGNQSVSIHSIRSITAVSGARLGYDSSRALDWTLAGILTIAGFFPVAIAAIAIRLTGTGPVIFRQTRYGMKGVPFTFYKLRTLDDDGRNLRLWFFPLGRFLRATRIDELPQLLHVFRGEMAIYGPRPIPDYQVAAIRHLSAIAAEQLERVFWQRPPGFINLYASRYGDYISPVEDPKAFLRQWKQKARFIALENARRSYALQMTEIFWTIQILARTLFSVIKSNAISGDMRSHPSRNDIEEAAVSIRALAGMSTDDSLQTAKVIAEYLRSGFSDLKRLSDRLRLATASSVSFPPLVVSAGTASVEIFFPETGGLALFETRGGRVRVADMRYILRSDLSSKEEAYLLDRAVEPAAIHNPKFYMGKRVLITGAAGSLGGALSRRLASLGASLVLVDREAQNLRHLAHELDPRGDRVAVFPLDLPDSAGLRTVFSRARPQIVFHLAAFKFSDLAELPALQDEVNRSNLTTTTLLLDAAEQAGTEIFLAMSSDKAANAANYYGQTKRVLEELLSAKASPRLKTVAVRSPNILGSTGSLVPLVENRLFRGLHIRVTRQKRMFLTAGEMVSVLLNSAAEADAGDLVIAKPKGQNDRIEDVVRRLARLRHRPLNVEYIGDRPGDKPQEELFTDAEREFLQDRGDYWVVGRGARLAIPIENKRRVRAVLESVHAQERAEAVRDLILNEPHLNRWALDRSAKAHFLQAGYNYYFQTPFTAVHVVLNRARDIAIRAFDRTPERRFSGGEFYGYVRQRLWNGRLIDPEYFLEQVFQGTILSVVRDVFFIFGFSESLRHFLPIEFLAHFYWDTASQNLLVSDELPPLANPRSNTRFLAQGRPLFTGVSRADQVPPGVVLLFSMHNHPDWDLTPSAVDLNAVIQEGPEVIVAENAKARVVVHQANPRFSNQGLHWARAYSSVREDLFSFVDFRLTDGVAETRAKRPAAGARLQQKEPWQLAPEGWSGYRVQFTPRFLREAPLDRSVRTRIANGVEGIRPRMANPRQLLDLDSKWNMKNGVYEAHVGRGYRVYFTYSEDQRTVTIVASDFIGKHKSKSGDPNWIDQSFVDGLVQDAKGAVSQDVDAVQAVGGWIFAASEHAGSMDLSLLSTRLIVQGDEILRELDARLFDRILVESRLDEIVRLAREAAGPSEARASETAVGGLWNDVNRLFQSSHGDVQAALGLLERREKIRLTGDNRARLIDFLETWKERSAELRAHLKRRIESAFADPRNVPFETLKALDDLFGSEIGQHLRRQFEEWSLTELTAADGDDAEFEKAAARVRQAAALWGPDGRPSIRVDRIDRIVREARAAWDAKKRETAGLPKPFEKLLAALGEIPSGAPFAEAWPVLVRARQVLSQLSGSEKNQAEEWLQVYEAPYAEDIRKEEERRAGLASAMNLLSAVDSAVSAASGRTVLGRFSEAIGEIVLTTDERREAMQKFHAAQQAVWNREKRESEVQPAQVDALKEVLRHYADALSNPALRVVYLVFADPATDFSQKLAVLKKTYPVFSQASVSEIRRMRRTLDRMLTPPEPPEPEEVPTPAPDIRSIFRTLDNRYSPAQFFNPEGRAKEIVSKLYAEKITDALDRIPEAARGRHAVVVLPLSRLAAYLPERLFKEEALSSVHILTPRPAAVRKFLAHRGIDMESGRVQVHAMGFTPLEPGFLHQLAEAVRDHSTEGTLKAALTKLFDKPRVQVPPVPDEIRRAGPPALVLSLDALPMAAIELELALETAAFEKGVLRESPRWTLGKTHWLDRERHTHKRSHVIHYRPNEYMRHFNRTAEALARAYQDLYVQLGAREPGAAFVSLAPAGRAQFVERDRVERGRKDNAWWDAMNRLTKSFLDAYPEIDQLEEFLSNVAGREGKGIVYTLDHLYARAGAASEDAPRLAEAREKIRAARQRLESLPSDWLLDNVNHEVDIWRARTRTVRTADVLEEGRTIVHKAFELTLDQQRDERTFPWTDYALSPLKTQEYRDVDRLIAQNPDAPYSRAYALIAAVDGYLALLERKDPQPASFERFHRSFLDREEARQEAYHAPHPESEDPEEDAKAFEGFRRSGWLGLAHRQGQSEIFEPGPRHLGLTIARFLARHGEWPGPDKRVFYGTDEIPREELASRKIDNSLLNIHIVNASFPDDTNQPVKGEGGETAGARLDQASRAASDVPFEERLVKALEGEGLTRVMLERGYRAGDVVTEGKKKDQISFVRLDDFQTGLESFTQVRLFALREPRGAYRVVFRPSGHKDDPPEAGFPSITWTSDGRIAVDFAAFRNRLVSKVHPKQLASEIAGLIRFRRRSTPVFPVKKPGRASGPSGPGGVAAALQKLDAARQRNLPSKKLKGPEPAIGVFVVHKELGAGLVTHSRKELMRPEEYEVQFLTHLTRGLTAYDFRTVNESDLDKALAAQLREKSDQRLRSQTAELPTIGAVLQQVAQETLKNESFAISAPELAASKGVENYQAGLVLRALRDAGFLERVTVQGKSAGSRAQYFGLVKDFLAEVRQEPLFLEDVAGMTAFGKPSLDEDEVEEVRGEINEIRQKHFGARLAGFFAGVKENFRDWKNKVVPLLVKGKKYLFHYEQVGDDTYAVAEGLEPVKLEKIAESDSGSPASADLDPMNRLMTARVHELFGGKGVSSSKRVILKVSADFLPASSFGVYAEPFFEALKQAARRKYGKNVLFVAAGKKAARMKELDPAGTFFAETISPDWVDAGEVLLDVPRAFEGLGLRVPVGALSEGDVPAYEAVIRLAIEAGRIDPDDIPDAFEAAFELLSGTRPGKRLLSRILKGTEPVSAAELHALKALQRAPLSDVVRFFRMLKRQFEQAA